MRLGAVFLCALGLAFGACGLSPIEDVPSAGDRSNDGSSTGGLAAGSGGSTTLPSSGGTGTGADGNVQPGAMAGSAGFAGAGGELL